MEELAQVYARSLFAVGREQQKLDLVREQLAQVADAIDTNRDLQIFFFSPYFSSAEKQDGLARVLEGADETVVNFLELLIEKHRMPVIFRIRAEFDRLFLVGMIQHHNGALIMVKDLFDTAGAGQDADLFNFATDADNSQRAEIRLMHSMLEKKPLEEKR